MDEWAASKGYTRDQKPFFLLPAFSYGEADYSPEVYEEYYKHQVEEAIKQIKNATPSSEPAVLTGPNGQEIPLMPTGSAIEQLGSEISALSAAVDALPAAVEAATTSSITSVTVEMDGEQVGRLVSQHMQRDMHRSALVTS